MNERTEPLTRFGVPANERWFEDDVPGTVYEFDGFVVDEEAVVRFAQSLIRSPFILTSGRPEPLLLAA